MRQLLLLLFPTLIVAAGAFIEAGYITATPAQTAAGAHFFYRAHFFYVAGIVFAIWLSTPGVPF